MPSSGLALVKLALLYLESEVGMVKIVKMTETLEMVKMVDMVGIG